MDRLLVFGGKLIQFSLKESDVTKNIVIEARVWSLVDNEGEWENESNIVLELAGTKSTVSVSILQTRNCLEIKTGFLLPVVILQVSSLRDPVNNQLYLVGLSLPTKSLILLKSVEKSDTTTTWTDRCVSFTALDGPVICWMKDGSHVMCVPGEDNPCQLKPTALPLEFKPSSIVGSYYSCRKFFFIANQKGKHARAYSVSDSTLVCENLPIERFYSAEFTNIVKIHFVDGKIFSSNSSDATTNPMIQTTLYAVTDEGYVLYFKDGQLDFAIPISEEIQISSDVELHVFCPYGLTKTLVAVHSDAAVFLLDTAERQVINTWTGVHACHCEDFVGLGCPQLLILKKGFDTNSGWLVTDTFSVLIDRLGEEGPRPETTATKKHEDSASAAIHALQTRLTNDLVVLGEKKREVTCKERFISRTWQTLQGNLQGRPLFQAKDDPSLITMLNKTEEQPSAGKIPKVENRSEGLTVTEIWQRVTEGQWVVGVDCIARNTLSLQVVLVPETEDLHFIGCITCSSNQLHDITKDFRKKPLSTTKSDEISSVHNSQIKRPRLTATCPEEEELSPLIKHFPACVASLPKFGRLRKVRCHVILQWTENDVNRQPHSGCQDCGIISLSVDDILQDKYDLGREATAKVETSRDLTTLSLTQPEVGLKLEGTRPYTVGCLRAWLEGRAGFTFRPVYRCYMSDVTSLHLVRIEVGDGAAGDEQLAKFTLSARNMEQIALTLHHLYSCFPDNVLILPDNQEVISRSLKVAVGNLEKELTYVTSAMKDLNKGKHSSIPEVHVEHEKGVDGHVDVERVRSNFAKRKRDLFFSDTEMVSTEDMEQFRIKLETLQINTDRSMKDLAGL
ncbi:uncharacterized protein LOC110456583 [Mizuhopecten yessoensis]|uniref:uncharacterized protein LOC110456583 n=1 Tax=Mizuhopecten yessoensis TaxID=6573 RepID=UPI000B45A87C|nr:uncharacterized protein LOC110456583 [Mizuhopecten yessoensis]